MITLPRGARLFSRVPLTWAPLRLEDGTLSAAAYCANGHFGRLTDHEIATDGTVTPSVVCPEEGCDWHEMVKLEGWGT